jgi:hypothetical protein
MLPEHNLPWWRHDRPWGFRFSAMDGFIFAGGAATTIALWEFVGPFALAVPYLLGHFFLFCNTFRVGGERSLIWVAAFLANAYFWTQTENLVFPLVVQELVTLALIIQCVLGKNYHGIACKQLNPDHYRDGAMSEGAFTRKVLLACRVPKPLIESLVGRRLEEFNQEP